MVVVAGAGAGAGAACLLACIITFVFSGVLIVVRGKSCPGQSRSLLCLL